MQPIARLWFILLATWGTFAQPAVFDIPRLTPDEAVTGTIDLNTSAQLYGFNAREGDTISAMMHSNDDALDAFLVLLDAQGAVIAYNDDESADTLDAALNDIEIPTTGSYLLLATTFENLDEFLMLDIPEPLPYTLTVDGFTADDAPLQLETTVVGLGEPFEGESTTAQPVHYLTFEATAGDMLDITLARVATIDPVLHIFTPNGKRIAFDDDDDSSRYYTTDAAVYGLEIPVDGRYLVLATDTFFYNANTPDAQLRYSPGTFVFEVNPTPRLHSPGS